ncbi:MAG: hypothetical protein V4568_06790 [Pseudomonadota bacterium]
MNDEQRIERIKKAKSLKALGEAIAGYHDQVIATYPALETNNAFNMSMQRSQFFHALGDVKRASRVGFDIYQDVILVLEAASEKQLSLESF